MSALDDLLNKGVDETTSLEHAVQILFLNEQTKGKPLANEAAAELAAKDAAIDAARKYVENDDNMNGYRYGVLVKALAALGKS